MKNVYPTLFCAALLAVSGLVPSWSDEVDALFSDQSVSISAQVDSPGVGPSDTGANFTVSGSENSAFSEAKHWNATIGPSFDDQDEADAKEASHDKTTVQHADRSPSTAAEDKAAPAAEVSAVPEPSAVALAVLALVYFLVFGRRRSPI